MRQEDTDIQALLSADLDQHFGHFVFTYQQRLYAFMLRQTGSSLEAEDIVQEAFMQAYFALSRYTKQQIRQMALRPWLFKIALNIFYSRIRKDRLPCLSLDGTEGASAFEIEDDSSLQPEMALESREKLAELGALMSTLPENQRSAMNLYYFEGLSYREIADLLNVPIGSYLAWSPDGKYIASASSEDGVIVWDAATGQNVYTKGHKVRVTDGDGREGPHLNHNTFAWSPDGKYIASASSEDGVIVWDAATGQNVYTKGHKVRVTDGDGREGPHLNHNTFAWSPDGKYLAFSDGSGLIQTWDAQTGGVTSEFSVHDTPQIDERMD